MLHNIKWIDRQLQQPANWVKLNFSCQLDATNDITKYTTNDITKNTTNDITKNTHPVFCCPTTDLSLS